MTYHQLERHFELLGVIERLEQRIAYTGSLRASRYDGVHISGGVPSDKTGDAAIERAELAEKLKRLEHIRDMQRPQVEETIQSIMKVVPVKKRLITGLVFRMRYCEGRDWFDIEAVTGIKNARQTVISTLEK